MYISFKSAEELINLEFIAATVRQVVNSREGMQTRKETSLEPSGGGCVE